jgi:hypothetical protein
MVLTFPTNIARYTDDFGDTFPAYISINAEGRNVEITVRGIQEDKQPGRTAMIPMQRAVFHKLLVDAKMELDRMILRWGA